MSFVVAKEQPVVDRGRFDYFQPVHPWTMQLLLQRENIFVFVSLFLALVAICCFKWIFYTVRCRIYYIYIYSTISFLGVAAEMPADVEAERCFLLNSSYGFKVFFPELPKTIQNDLSDMF